MHHIHTIIGQEALLSNLAAEYPEAHLARLPQGFVLIPLTEALHDAMTAGKAAQPVPPFERLSAPVAAALAELSLAGKVAYVETDYFGGTGTQASAVWERGTLLLAPRLSSWEPAWAPEQPARVLEAEPINMALATLGVAAGAGAVDLFDAIGLGNFRSTESWANAAEKR